MKLNDILQEGLIKIDPQIVEKITKLFYNFVIFHLSNDLISNKKLLQSNLNHFAIKKTPEEVMDEFDNEVDNLSSAKNLGFSSNQMYSSDFDIVETRRIIYPKAGRFNLTMFAGKSKGTRIFGEVIKETGDMNLYMTGIIGTNELKQLLSNGFTNLSDLYEKMKHLIEHELTHVYQVLVLSKKDPRQIHSDYDSNLPEFTDDYYLGQVEFDPWIKDTINYVKTSIKNNKLNSKKSRQLLDYIFNVSSDYEQLDDKLKHLRHFFSVLKNKNYEKYKKAVKYVFSNV